MPNEAIASIPKTDCYRNLLRSTPSNNNPGAHLAWIRLLSSLLAELEEWTPCFSTALVAQAQNLEFFRPFCESGTYEESYFKGIPQALNFLDYFLKENKYDWLSDLARCEAWYSFKKGIIPVEIESDLRKLLKVGQEPNHDFLIVNYDILVALQAIVGYRDTTLDRVSRLLWLLNVEPIRPIFDVPQKAGVILAVGEGESVELSFLSLLKN